MAIRAEVSESCRNAITACNKQIRQEPGEAQGGHVRPCGGRLPNERNPMMSNEYIEYYTFC
jgi:hypothetical protein